MDTCCIALQIALNNKLVIKDETGYYIAGDDKKEYCEYCPFCGDVFD